MITHARTDAARFLGYEITVQHSDGKVTRGRRAANGVIGRRVPLALIRAKCAPYLKRGMLTAVESGLARIAPGDLACVVGIFRRRFLADDAGLTPTAADRVAC